MGAFYEIGVRRHTYPRGYVVAKNRQKKFNRDDGCVFVVNYLLGIDAYVRASPQPTTTLGGVALHARLHCMEAL